MPFSFVLTLLSHILSLVLSFLFFSFLFFSFLFFSFLFFSFLFFSFLFFSFLFFSFLFFSFLFFSFLFFSFLFFSFLFFSFLFFSFLFFSFLFFFSLSLSLSPCLSLSFFLSLSCMDWHSNDHGRSQVHVSEHSPFIALACHVKTVHTCWTPFLVFQDRCTYPTILLLLRWQRTTRTPTHLLDSGYQRPPTHTIWRIPRSSGAGVSNTHVSRLVNLCHRGSFTCVKEPVQLITYVVILMYNRWPCSSGPSAFWVSFFHVL